MPVDEALGNGSIPHKDPRELETAFRPPEHKKEKPSRPDENTEAIGSSNIIKSLLRHATSSLFNHTSKAINTSFSRIFFGGGVLEIAVKKMKRQPLTFPGRFKTKFHSVIL
jgi:hypothetical protein